MCNSQTVSGSRRPVTGRMISVLKKNSLKPDARKKYICNTCVQIVWKLFAKMSFNATPVVLTFKNKHLLNSHQKQKRKLNQNRKPSKSIKSKKQNRQLNPGHKSLEKHDPSCFVCGMKCLITGLTLDNKSLRKKVERALNVKALNRMHRICDTCKLSVEKVCKALNKQKRIRTLAGVHVPDSDEATEPAQTESRKPCEGVDIVSTKTVDDNIIVKARINEQPVVLKVPMAFKMRVYTSCKFKDCSFACRYISDMMDHYIREHVDYKKIIKNIDGSMENIVVDEKASISHSAIVQDIKQDLEALLYNSGSSVSAASTSDTTCNMNIDGSSTSVDRCFKDESLSDDDLIEISASDEISSLNMTCHSVVENHDIKSEPSCETDVAIIKSEPPCETDVAIIKSEHACETDVAIIKSEPPCETGITSSATPVDGGIKSEHLDNYDLIETSKSNEIVSMDTTCNTNSEKNTMHDLNEETSTMVSVKRQEAIDDTGVYITNRIAVKIEPPHE